MNYKLFTNIKVIQAILFLFIPLVLWVSNGSLLDSVTDYSYKVPFLFAFVLTLAGSVFFYDGFVSPRRWYNLISGISLFAVVLFPHFNYPTFHYMSAAIFFLWSSFSMVYFSGKRQRVYKVASVAVIIMGIAIHYAFGWYSLFFAEWIGMLPITVHYILEALDLID